MSEVVLGQTSKNDIGFCDAKIFMYIIQLTVHAKFHIIVSTFSQLSDIFSYKSLPKKSRSTRYYTCKLNKPNTI